MSKLQTKVLSDIREGLGVIVEADEESPYDSQLLMHLEPGIMALHQIGAVTDKAFELDKDTTWEQIISGVGFISIKSYLLGTTRLLFDPPNNETLIGVINDRNAETYWRLSAMYKTQTPTIEN